MQTLVASFERIARESMRGLPFYNEALSVEAVGFERIGDGWLGVLITPWFMNLMLVSDQPIPYAEAANGKRRSVELPGGPVKFLCGGTEDFGMFDAHSIASPMDVYKSQDQARRRRGLRSRACGRRRSPRRRIRRRRRSRRVAKKPLQFCRAAAKLRVFELIPGALWRSSRDSAMRSLRYCRDDSADRKAGSRAIQVRRAFDASIHLVADVAARAMTSAVDPGSVTIDVCLRPRPWCCSVRIESKARDWISRACSSAGAWTISRRWRSACFRCAAVPPAPNAAEPPAAGDWRRRSAPR